MRPSAGFLAVAALAAGLGGLLTGSAPLLGLTALFAVLAALRLE